MSEFWGHFEIPPHAAHRGVMVQGNYAVDYYTSQPDPAHWIAVGLVGSHSVQRPGLRRLLVGQGDTEPEAINALWRRTAELLGQASLPGIFEAPANDRDGHLTSSRTCVRIYLVEGSRFTIPDAASIREDPGSDSLICVDANDRPIKTIQRDQVLGYLVIGCDSEACLQTHP